MPLRFLVTAGNTREMIDRVRDWGNIFTGNTGYSIARALAALGEVDLLTSNRWHLAEVATSTGNGRQLRASSFNSHQDLKGSLEAMMSRGLYDAIFMTAAVADYRPVRVFQVIERTAREGGEGAEQWIVRDVQAQKVKSSHGQIAILGEQTEKLVDLFRGKWGHKGLLFKFKLEVGIAKEELLRIARASRIASGADYVIANTLEMVNGASAGAYLVGESGEEFVARAALATRVVDEVRARLVRRG